MVKKEEFWVFKFIFLTQYGKIRAEPLEWQLTRAYRAATQILSSSGQIRAVESPAIVKVTYNRTITECLISEPEELTV